MYKKIGTIGVIILSVAICFGNMTTAYADLTQEMIVTAEVEKRFMGPDASTFRVTGYSGTYDGREHTFGTVTIGDASVISYSKDGGSTWQTAKPTVKDVADSAIWQVRATLNNKSIYTTATLTVSCKAATITVKNATKKHGASDPAFEATESGLVSGEAIDYTVYRTNTAEDMGTYEGVLDVRLNQEYPNYNISIRKGNLTITENEFDTIKKNFSVTGYSGTYDGKEHTLTIKNSGNADVTYSKDGNTWTETKPAAMDVTDSSTWKIKASLGDNSIIKTAALTVKQKEVTVIVKNATKISEEDDPDYSATVKGMLNNETLDYTVIRTDTSEKTGKHEGVLSIRLNQEYPNYKVTVIKGNLTITENEYENLKDSFEVHGYSGTYDGKTHGAKTWNRHAVSFCGPCLDDFTDGVPA